MAHTSRLVLLVAGFAALCLLAIVSPSGATVGRFADGLGHGRRARLRDWLLDNPGVTPPTFLSSGDAAADGNIAAISGSSGVSHGTVNVPMDPIYSPFPARDDGGVRITNPVFDVPPYNLANYGTANPAYRMGNSEVLWLDPGRTTY
jgi:hypothetical protein